jgi:hypothetical protein
MNRRFLALGMLGIVWIAAVVRASAQIEEKSRSSWMD